MTVSPRYMRLIPVLALVVAHVFPPGAGAEDCRSCPDTPPGHADAVAFLTDAGYPSSSYALLIAWSETARFAAEPVILHGYRVAPTDGRPAFDLYADETGAILSAEELLVLGVSPKKWALAPVESFSETPGPLRKAVEQRPVPKGPIAGRAPTASISLPDLDLPAILEEDLRAEARPSKGAKRIGVFQELPLPVSVQGVAASHGVWTTLVDGGALWSVALTSPGARGQRVRFTELALPAGARLLVYNAGNPIEAYGPLTRIAPGDADLWSPTCFAETVVVECAVRSIEDVRDVRIQIDKTIHIYGDFSLLPWAKGLGDAGFCNLDVACFSEWRETSSGVGGIGTVGSNGYLWCTGALLADDDPGTHTPYFLTANHCVAGPTAASSIEVYWLWQAAECGGAPPHVTSVPRTTGGADYLAGSTRSAGTDFTLLRLRNPAPSEATFLGWAATPVSANTQLVGIHHPSGDYKRISFGLKTLDSGSYHEVLWSAGTTEPGSSGSPLFLQDTQQIVGQLYGGWASCYQPHEPDYYGRFDVTFPLVQHWLAAYIGPEDVNGDGQVNALDVQLVINAVLGKSVPHDADVNGDGKVDALDLQQVIIVALSR